MAEVNYGLGDLSYQGIRIRTTTGTESLNFKVWGGMVRVNVTTDKTFKPIFELPLNSDKITVITKLIHMIKKASPGTKCPMTVSDWSQNEKKWVRSCSLAFVKDDKNVYHIEFQWKGNKFDAVLKGPAGLSCNSDQMSDAERSEIALDSLLTWLNTTSVLQCVLSNRKREMSASASASQRSSSSQSNHPAEESDDEFF